MEPQSSEAAAVGTLSDASPDLDAQTMVINSLRTQLDELYSQVTQLNGKLVQSYDRVSDLEDDLHVTSDKLRSSTVKISELEMERLQHLAALNTGLLVEKSQVTTELSRLMERATEEAAQRGQAESARHKIEKELDDLAASLFEKANTMVAEARFAQSQSENKVNVAQQALKSAEEAISIMQLQMQDMRSQKEDAERNAETARSIMEKGKWVDKSLNEDPAVTRRLMNSHLPYQEFLLFIAHLRSVHATTTSPTPPALATLLTLPFLSRLVAEDVEPTIRLDLAPSLNWLSRRSVLTAMHQGQLNVEPMSSQTLLLEHTQSQASLAGFNSSTNTICCALCGASMFTIPDARQRTLTSTLTSLSLSRTSSMGGAWFKNPLSPSAQPSPPPTPPLQKSYDPNDIPPQVYVFRLSSSNTAPANGTIVSTPSSFTSTPSTSATASPLPSSQIVQTQVKPSSIYPLCTDGWCLTRLRTTCSLWAFVRTGIVEKVWEEEIPSLPPPQRGPPGTKSPVNGSAPASPEKPKRKGIWGMASALTERASNWTGDGDKEKKGEKKQPPPPIDPPVPQKTTSASLPPPLPERTSNRDNTPVTRFVAPPLDVHKAQKPHEVEAGQTEPQPVTIEPVQREPTQSEPTKLEPTQPESTKLEQPMQLELTQSESAQPEHPQEVIAPETPKATTTPEPSSFEPPRSPPLPAKSPRARPLSSTVLASEAAKIAEPLGHSSPRIRSRPPSGIISEAPPRASTPPLRPPPRAPRPMSPRAIPLPESRPGTPTQSQFPSSGPTENLPPRSSSPAPVNATPGSAAPPVPPRRPPRRARPMSTLISPASPTPPTPSAPAPPSRPATPVQALVPVESPVIDKPSSDDATNSSEFVMPKSEETEEITTIEEKKEDTKIEETADPAASAQQLALASPKPPFLENSDGASEEAKDVLVSTANEPPPIPPRKEQISAEQNQPIESPSVEEDIQGTYVGNATWEERTWKEVVRLRQEMFWARTGCIYI